MKDKSNRYSFAAGVLLLISFLSFAYEWLIDPLRMVGGHYTDKGFFEYLKSLYTSESSSRGEIAQTVLIVSLALLTIAAFRQNVLLFLVGMVLDLGVLTNEYLLFREQKYTPDFWDSYRRLGFVTTYVVPAVVVCLLLVLAVALLLNKSFAKWICLAVIAVATIGFLLEAVLCIGQYVSSSWAWQKGHLDRVFFSYSRHDTFYMTAGYTPVSYFTRAAIAVLVALWGMGRCKANAQK